MITKLLVELTEKYSVTSNVQVNFEPGAITVQCAKGGYRFYYDFAGKPKEDSMQNVPMLHWRLKRRYIELKNVLDQELVKTALALRIHHIVPKEDFSASLEDTLFMEIDLAQWICGDKVNQVFASMEEHYMNAILSTKGGVKLSMELGLTPDGSQPVLLHEIIAKTGILSDVAVDTQTQQYPIYIFHGHDTKVYTDIDYELYGLSQSECDSVRFILWILNEESRVPYAQEIAKHIQAVICAAKQSSKSVVYTPVEGGAIA